MNDLMKVFVLFIVGWTLWILIVSYAQYRSKKKIFPDATIRYSSFLSLSMFLAPFTLFVIVMISTVIMMNWILKWGLGILAVGMALFLYWEFTYWS